MGWGRRASGRGGCGSGRVALVATAGLILGWTLAGARLEISGGIDSEEWLKNHCCGIEWEGEGKNSLIRISHEDQLLCKLISRY